MVLQIIQILLENTCVGVSFLIRLQTWGFSVSIEIEQWVKTG